MPGLAGGLAPGSQIEAGSGLQNNLGQSWPITLRVAPRAWPSRCRGRRASAARRLSDGAPRSGALIQESAIRQDRPLFPCAPSADVRRSSASRCATVPSSGWPGNMDKWPQMCWKVLDGQRDASRLWLRPGLYRGIPDVINISSGCRPGPCRGRGSIGVDECGTVGSRDGRGAGAEGEAG